MHILVIISNPNVMISYSLLSNAYAMFGTSMKLFWGIFSKGINDTNEIILWDSSNERMRAQWFTQFFGSNTRTSCCQKGPKRSTTKPTLPNSWKRRFISSHFRWIDLHYFHSLLITSTFLLNSHPLLSAHSFIHSFLFFFFFFIFITRENGDLLLRLRRQLFNAFGAGAGFGFGHVVDDALSTLSQKEGRCLSLLLIFL